MVRIAKLPDGEKIREYIQCGTCSASCPARDAMDFSPRQVIAAIRAGMTEEVLNSDTAWSCASCYMCTVRCPAGIPFTDIMYEIKRTGRKLGLCSKTAKSPRMAEEFLKSLVKNGRMDEVSLMRNYYLRTGIHKAVGQIPLTWKLWSRGRLHLAAHKI